MKKRAVLDLLRKNYDRSSRFYHGSPKHTITVNVYVNKFPATLGLTHSELATILLEIEKDYKGKIRVRPLNDNNLRIKLDYYPVEIKPKTFPRDIRPSKKPTITPHDGSYCITPPGQKQLIPVGRIGSLNGELFRIMAERWGTFQSVEYVLGELKAKVTDMRTRGYHSPEIIREHLKEINKTLSGGGERRLHRIGDWPRSVGIIFDHFLWTAIVRKSRGVLTVGFAKVAKPTRMKKKPSK